MNLRTTIVLAFLAVAGGLLWWQYPQWAPRVGLTPKTDATSASSNVENLERQLTREKLRRVEIRSVGEPVVFEKNADGVWSMPGGWPTKKEHADKVIDLLTQLRSRHNALVVSDPDVDLKKYGLDLAQTPITVIVQADENITLHFGEPAAEDNPFARPTFMRIADRPEVVQLGPGILPILRRSRESYQRQQLYADTERVKFVEPGALPVQVPRARSITLREGQNPPVVLRFKEALPPSAARIAVPISPMQLAERWEIVDPVPSSNTHRNEKATGPSAGPAPEMTVTDFVDPDKLRSLLTAAAELRVDSFAEPKPESLLAVALAGSPLSVLPPADAGGLAAIVAASSVANRDATRELRSWSELEARHFKPTRFLEMLGVKDMKRAWLYQRFGLHRPVYRVTFTPPAGDPLTIHIGIVVSLKPSDRLDELRYARIAGLDRVFTIKADKINDLFVTAAALRDERVARFQVKDVSRVEINPGPGKVSVLGLNLEWPRPAIALVRDKVPGQPDKWKVVKPWGALAGTEKVTSLLSALETLSARGDDVIDRAAPGQIEFDAAQSTRVALTIEEELPSIEGKQKRTRIENLTFGRAAPSLASLVANFGRGYSTLGKVAVKTDRRKRVNLVNQSILAQATQRPEEYLGSSVLDFQANNVERIEFRLADQSLLNWRHEEFAFGQKNNEWELVAPVAAKLDSARIKESVDALAALKTTRHAFVNPTPAQIVEAGLSSPRLSIDISFTEGRKPQKLLVGQRTEVSDREEYFARLQDGPTIFVIAGDVIAKLNRSSLDYRPAQLWTLTPPDVTALKIERGSDAFELKSEGPLWKIVKPFEAMVGPEQTQPFVGALVSAKPIGYVTHAPKSAADFGLAPPQIKITFTAIERNMQGIPSAPKDRTLLIGKKVPDRNEVYAQMGDDPAVFTIPDAIVRFTAQSSLDFLDRNLLALDPRRVIKVERTGTSKLIATRQGATQTWMVQSDAASWPADQPTIASMLAAAAPLRADRVVAHGAAIKPADFGLEPAAEVVKFSSEVDGAAPAIKTLRIGKTAEGGGRFAKIDGEQTIGVLTDAVVRELTRSALDFADKSLLAFDAESLQSIKRQMKDNDLELTKSGGWKIIRPSDQKADDILMDEWARQLVNLRAERVAAFAPADLKPFGLDAPTATLVIEGDKEGKPLVQTLKVGAPVDPKEPSGDRFAMVDGSKAVAVVSRAIAKQLLNPPIAFRDRALVRRLTEPDRVVLERGERKATFAKSAGSWKMTEPVASDAEHAELEDFVNLLFRLRAAELVAEKPSAEKLKEFGLDKPETTWRFFAGQREVLALILGKRDSTDQRVYGKLGTGEIVFLLEPAVTARTAAEYRKRDVWQPLNPDDIKSVTLGAAGVNTTLTKALGIWQIDGKPETKLDQIQVEELIATLAGLKVERFVADKDAALAKFGLDKPRRTFTVKTNTTTLVLNIGSVVGSEKRVHAAVAGRSEVFILGEAATNKLDRDLGSLIQK